MKHILLLFSFLFPVSASAQEQTLSLTQAWAKALSANQSLKAKEYEKKQYEYSYLSSLNSYLPQISLSHSFSRSGGDSSSVSNRFSASVSASQEIFNLKTISSIKISKYSLETAQISYRTALCDLRKDFFTAYLNLYFAQEKVKVSERILEIRKENAKLISLKYESGMESRGNMLYSAAQAEMAALSLRRAKRDLENYQEELSKIMGETYDKNIAAQYNLEIPSQNYSYEEILKNSFYPDLAVYEKNLASAKERLLSGKYDALPSLKASGSWSYSGDYEFPKNKSWSLGLSMSLPLFSGGPFYYYSNTNSLKNAVKSAEKKLEEAKLAYEKNLRSYLRDFENASDTARVYMGLKQADEERYKEGQIQYMAGKLSFINLENLEQNMIDSKINYLEYIKNAWLKKIALERLMGKDSL
ncbi:MAG: TolC family protein [Elusimicrobia bacterium]|nr:TolC family protein [Elusimicrobiota bacterium]